MTNGDRIRKMNDDELTDFFKSDLICNEMSYKYDECEWWSDCKNCHAAWVKRGY